MVLRDYNRNENFAANGFFNNKNGVAQPKLNRNQFGGNLGGPLPFPRFGEVDPEGPWWKSGKDRLFFFFDYEGRRDAREATYTRIVPLNHVRNGGLAYISGTADACEFARLDDPATAGCITVLNATQVRNLDPLGIGASPALSNFVNSRYPRQMILPRAMVSTPADLRSTLRSSERTTRTRRAIDANINDRQKAFVRFNIVRSQSNG